MSKSGGFGGEAGAGRKWNGMELDISSLYLGSPLIISKEKN